MTLPATGDALPDIFPEVPVACRAVLFAGFAPVPALTAADWEAAVDVVVANGLAGLALHVVRAGGLPVGRDVKRALRDAAFRDREMTLRTVGAGSGPLADLRKADIPFVVVKGPGTASSPGWHGTRPFCDLDVLVDRSDFRRSLRLLEGSGLVEAERTRPPWTSFNHLCREAVNLRRGDGASIDLHHHVAPWLWSSAIPIQQVIASAGRQTVGGSEVPVATTEWNFVVSCLHVVSDKSLPGSSLRVWRDILVLRERCDDDRLREVLEVSRLGPWVAWIWGCLPGEVRHGALPLPATGPRGVGAARRLTLLTPPHFGSQHHLGVALRLPLPRAVTFVAGSIVPSPAYLSARLGAGGRLYRRWWKGLPEMYRTERKAQPADA